MKWLFLLVSSVCFGFEKLDPKYCVRYGDENAKTQVVEYVSLSCAQCLKLFQKDFAAVKAKYIDTGEVSWVFHPNPADILTLQMMVCLERLPEQAKTIFFEAVMRQEAMPEDLDLETLEKTEAFQAAFQFVTQEDGIAVIPAVEVNGVLYEEFPSISFIERKIL